MQFKKGSHELKLSSILSESEVQLIHLVCESIESAIRTYYEGFPSESYSIFKGGIDKLSSYFKNLTLFNCRSSAYLQGFRDGIRLLVDMVRFCEPSFILDRKNVLIQHYYSIQCPLFRNSHCCISIQ
jgi:hypothetical protein